MSILRNHFLETKPHPTSGISIGDSVETVLGRKLLQVDMVKIAKGYYRVTTCLDRVSIPLAVAYYVGYYLLKGMIV